MSGRDLVADVIDSVVGADVLGLPGQMFAALGDYSIAAWALGALAMGFIGRVLRESRWAVSCHRRRLHR